VWGWWWGDHWVVVVILGLVGDLRVVVGYLRVVVRDLGVLG